MPRHIQHPLRMLALATLLGGFLLPLGPALGQVPDPLALEAWRIAHLGAVAYEEDFAGLGGGLPSGWMVTFEAAPDRVGTLPDPRRLKLEPNADPDPMKNTAWSGLDQVFRNFAGRSLFLSTAGQASLDEQAEAADRALGVRTGNAYGESYFPVGEYDSGGAAFVFSVDSRGWRLTTISFDMALFGSLEEDGRGQLLDWQLQVSNSATGNKWSKVIDIPSFGDDPSAADYRTVSLSFRNRALFDRLATEGIQLDDAPVVHFRIVATGKFPAAAGSSASARYSYAVDNFRMGFTNLSDTAFDEEEETYSAILALPASQVYNQDFAVIDRGRLPSGWNLTRTATPTSTGSLLPLDSIETRNGTLADNLAYRVAWTNSNGTFKNFANPGTLPKGPWLNDQAQEAFSDRMLGFRANAQTGDTGHAFVFRCNAYGYRNLKLSVDVFSTNASERPIDIVIQCSTNGGSAWTTLRALPALGQVPSVEEAGLRMCHPVTAFLPVEASNCQDLLIRIAGLTLSPGGNPGGDSTRTAIAIDDFQLTYQSVDAGNGDDDLLGYALGIEDSTSGALQTVFWSNHHPDGRLSLHFMRARAPEDITYIVQQSSDLYTWTDYAVNPGQFGDLVSVTAESVFTRNFLRLQVFRPLP